jgi:hypothetical protein
MSVVIRNEIDIAVPPDVLFNYVTQPWLWHEWHPSSRSASSPHSFLATGDEFEEYIEVRPLAPLPPRMLRQTTYTVTESVPLHTWEVRGEMKGGWLRIRYDFEESGGGDGVTRFHRTLEFDASGVQRILLPLLAKKMQTISLSALENLKQKLEFQ